jgi:hypothetical protein
VPSWRAAVLPGALRFNIRVVFGCAGLKSRKKNDWR